jgi:hypothetical protein
VIAVSEKRLRFIAFVKVASTPDGKPVYSIADIIEPLPRHNGSLLRSARITAGERGYVLVARAGLEWDDYKACCRRVPGLPSGRRFRKAA